MKVVMVVLCTLVAGCNQSEGKRPIEPAAPEKLLNSEGAVRHTSLENNPAVLAWRSLDSKCRGDLAGDDPQSGRVCAQRAQAAKQLAKQGICYGKKGQLEGEYEWHKCGPGSLRFPGS